VRGGVFEQISRRLQEILRRLTGKGKLTAADVDQAVRQVRLALLEADVHYRVVKEFCARLRERAVGAEVMESLTPGQQVVKLVHEELRDLLGQRSSELQLEGDPAVLLVVGLYGAGKTTTAAKLGRWLASKGRRPLLVAADLHRPAAPEQLMRMAEQAQVPCFYQPGIADPVALVRKAASTAREQGRDVLVVDTAGRFQVEEELMRELTRLADETEPSERLLVLDVMTGQEAVAVAQGFHQQLGLTGLILTKLDGDARGGAALSVRAVTGCPIKFVGTGERVDALEVFHPDRMASRILGMGDVLTLIERATRAVDETKAREWEKKLRRDTFDLEDFLEQLKRVREMGPLDELVSMLPGWGRRAVAGLQVDERELVKVEAIINSMTREERRDPDIIDGSRRRRIAAGSGTRVSDVNRVLRQFREFKRLFRQLEEGGKRLQRRFFPLV